jgi:hypothetical protein
MFALSLICVAVTFRIDTMLERSVIGWYDLGYERAYISLLGFHAPEWVTGSVLPRDVEVHLEHQRQIPSPFVHDPERRRESRGDIEFSSLHPRRSATPVAWLPPGRADGCLNE